MTDASEGKRPVLRRSLIGLLVVVLVSGSVVGCTSSADSVSTPTTSRLVVTVSPSVVQPSESATDTIPPAVPPSGQSPPVSAKTDMPSSSTEAESTSVALTASSDLSAAELADRAAIEAQWAKYWALNAELMKIPADERERRIDEVAVEPQRSKLLGSAQMFETEGFDYYGTVGLRPFWPVPVDGQSFALLRDCQDQSGWGSVNLSTGELRSIGVDRHFVQAGFQRGADGVWRVQNVQWIENFQC